VDSGENRCSSRLGFELGLAEKDAVDPELVWVLLLLLLTAELDWAE
jgi:hypothetical protein